MMQAIKKGAAVVAVFVVGALFLTGAAQAQEAQEYLGLSPATIQSWDLLRDVGSTHTVTLQRPDDRFDETFNVSFTGNDARYLVGEKEVFMPAGASKVTYTFAILPKEAPTGGYQAKINFTSRTAEGSDSGGTGISIIRGVTLVIDFSVTDEEVVDFDIENLISSPTEEDLPLPVQFVIINRGNVEWRPDKIVFTFENPRTGEIIVRTIPREAIDPVRPGVRFTPHVNVNHGLDEGNYRLFVEFFYNDEVIFSHEDRVEVLERGTLKQSGEFISLTPSKEQFVPGENVKVTAVFKNTGEVPVLAKLVAEAYSQDGELLDVLISRNVSVGRGDEVNLDVFISFDEPGVYEFLGKIEFGNKVSDTKTTSIEVTVPEAAGIGLNILLIAGLGLPGLILLVLLVVLLLRRKRKKAHAPSVSRPVLAGRAVVSGTSPDPDGTLVEVYVDNKPAGSAYVQSGAFSAPVNPQLLRPGKQVRALARIDSNKDGKVDQNDRPSPWSRGVVVEQSKQTPVQPAPQAAPEASQAPQPAQPPQASAESIETTAPETPAQAPVETPAEKPAPKPAEAAQNTKQASDADSVRPAQKTAETDIFAAPEQVESDAAKAQAPVEEGRPPAEEARKTSVPKQEKQGQAAELPAVGQTVEKSAQQESKTSETDDDEGLWTISL